MPRDQRNVRDRFNKLLSEFKAKTRKENEKSGTNPEPLSEAETMSEEIQEQIVSAKIDMASATAKEGEQKKNERGKAMDVRGAAMNTWAKSKCVVDSDGEECAKEKPRKRRRKGGSDALKFLEAKCQAGAEVKKEEVALRQQELALQQKWQGKFEAQMLFQKEQLQQQAVHQQQQFNPQQQQLQQTQNLILALLQKSSKD